MSDEMSAPVVVPPDPAPRQPLTPQPAVKLAAAPRTATPRAPFMPKDGTDRIARHGLKPAPQEK